MHMFECRLCLLAGIVLCALSVLKSSPAVGRRLSDSPLFSAKGLGENFIPPNPEGLTPQELYEGEEPRPFNIGRLFEQLNPRRVVKKIDYSIAKPWLPPILYDKLVKKSRENMSDTFSDEVVERLRKKFLAGNSEEPSIPLSGNPEDLDKLNEAEKDEHEPEKSETEESRFEKTESQEAAGENGDKGQSNANEGDNSQRRGQTPDFGGMKNKEGSNSTSEQDSEISVENRADQSSENPRNGGVSKASEENLMASASDSPAANFSSDSNSSDSTQGPEADQGGDVPGDQHAQDNLQLMNFEGIQSSGGAASQQDQSSGHDGDQDKNELDQGEGAEGLSNDSGAGGSGAGLGNQLNMHESYSLIEQLQNIIDFGLFDFGREDRYSSLGFGKGSFGQNFGGFLGPKERFRFDRGPMGSGSKLESLPKITNELFIGILENLVRELWIYALSQYDSQANLQNSISDFYSIANKLFTNNQQLDVLRPYLVKSQGVLDEVQNSCGRYLTLLDLVRKLKIPNNRSNSTAALSIIKKVLEEKNSLAKLNGAEYSLYRLLEDLLTSDPSTEISNEELGRAFLDHVTGPMVHRYLSEAYALQGTEYDWNKLASHLKTGKLNTILLAQRLNPYLDLFVKSQKVTRKSLKRTRIREPKNDFVPRVGVAEDFPSSPERIRSELPPEHWPREFLSSDLVEDSYNEHKVVTTPKDKEKHTIWIVMKDISGSMQKHRRSEIRDTLVAEFINISQMDVAKGRGKSELYFFSFDGRIHEDGQVLSQVEALEKYKSLQIASPSPGNSTLLNDALVRCFEAAKEFSERLANATNVNILFITDAQKVTVDVERVEKARSELPDNLDVALNIIALGTDNPDLRGLAEKTDRSHQDRQDTRAYTYISNRDTTAIFAKKTQLPAIESVALKSKDLFKKVQEQSLSRSLVSLLVRADQQIRDGRHFMDGRGNEFYQEFERYGKTLKKSVGKQVSLSDSFLVYLNQMGGARSSRHRTRLLYLFVKATSERLTTPIHQVVKSLSHEDITKLVYWSRTGKIKH